MAEQRETSIEQNDESIEEGNSLNALEASTYIGLASANNITFKEKKPHLHLL